MMKRIYLAGPYSADNIMDVLGNIRRGVHAGADLMRRGYAVFCPFLDFQFALCGFGDDLPKRAFQDNSLAWVEVSDVVVVLPGSEQSNGVKREVERAAELGIEVMSWECFQRVHG